MCINLHLHLDFLKTPLKCVLHLNGNLTYDDRLFAPLREAIQNSSNTSAMSSDQCD